MDAQALLQMFVASQGRMDASTLLQQLGGDNDDPTFQMLSSMMAQRNAATEEEEEDAEEEAEDDAHKQRVTELERRLDQNLDLLHQLDSELQKLREKFALFARALGACTQCCGLDPACELCAGQGQPGVDPPDPALFARYVLPALRRLAGELRRRTRQPFRRNEIYTNASSGV